MLKYTIETDEPRLIAGLGSFKPGQPQTLGPEVAQSFQTIRGLQLVQSNLPKGVTLTIEVVREEH